MSIFANDRDDKGKATVTVHGATLRVSEDGAAVEQQTPAGWVTLPQIADKFGKGFTALGLRRPTSALGQQSLLEHYAVLRSHCEYNSGEVWTRQNSR